VHEADGVELLMTCEAAGRLAGNGAGGVVGAVGEAALAPGIVAQAFQHRPTLVCHDGDGAQMVQMEIAGGDGLVAVLDVHADDAAGADQVVGPAHGAAGARAPGRARLHQRNLGRQNDGLGLASTFDVTRNIMKAAQTLPQNTLWRALPASFD
jgi:hypothetical protein